MSATTSTFDHRVHHVVVVAPISVNVGLTSGIGLAVGCLLQATRWSGA
ncbi:hypothetical protein ACFV9W_01670 [Streptomyces sp. NPDC059897]